MSLKITAEDLVRMKNFTEAENLSQVDVITIASKMKDELESTLIRRRKDFLFNLFPYLVLIGSSFFFKFYIVFVLVTLVLFSEFFYFKRSDEARDLKLLNENFKF